MKDFIMLGNVEGQDTLVEIVSANTIEEASEVFENWLKLNQTYKFGDDVYIQSGDMLEEMLASKVVANEFKDYKKRYQDHMNNVKQSTDSFALAYEIATKFNPFDQELILNHLLEHENAEVFYDEDAEVITVTRYDTSVELDANNETQLIEFWETVGFQYWHFLVDLYLDEAKLHAIIDSEDVSFTTLPTIPR